MRRPHRHEQPEHVTADNEQTEWAATSAPDRVLAILVVHGDHPWQEVAAARVSEHVGAGRRHAADFRLLVVDNGGSPPAAEFADRTGAPLIHLSKPQTFGAAVAAGLGHRFAEDAEFILLLHDDLVLDGDAVAAMVAVMDQRPEVAIAGPKLLEWKREPILQQVGMTIDAFGRAESHLHDGELDQGQHDHRSETLYVSSAGMLIRKRVFLELGGFDPRFPAMRDDLDLCWRAWLAGHRVEVVPEAVGWHVAAAARTVRRRGTGRQATTRYLAERHTLASMIKNLGLLRLTWTLPIVVVLAIAKSFGFLLTRRVSSAAAPLAALAWNVRSLPGTLRLRSLAQSPRQRSDAELTDLFAQSRWRGRAYAEALRDWLADGTSTALTPDESLAGRVHRSERSALFRPLDALQNHPVLVVGGGLTLLWLIACIPLLGRGQVIGGQIAAWPEGAMAFLSGYAAPWGEGAVASGALDSPIQPVLGLLSALVGGGAWLAQRLVLLGLVPLTWATAVRAGRLLTPRPAPRVVGATLYTVSPFVLGAFAEGRLDLLTLAAALPAVVILAIRAFHAGVQRSIAWRATALLAVVAAIALSVAPSAWPVLLLVLVGVAALASMNRSTRRPTVLRVVVVLLTVAALLLPWLAGMGSPTMATATAAGQASEGAPLRLWEALIGYTHALPGVGGIVRWLWVATAAAVVVAAVTFGMADRGATTLVLLGTMLAFGGAAALVTRDGAPVTEPVMVALPALLALAGLAVTAARSAGEVLSKRDVGVRHAFALLAAAAVILGPAAVAGRAVSVAEWPGLHLNPQIVPLFVQADAERLGPYRILILEGDSDGMRWDVTEPFGPSMTSFGAAPSRGMVESLDDVVSGMLASDRRAAGLAGVLNVRYVVLRDAATREAVEPALAELAAVEPMAAGNGRVYQVRTWLPRAAVVAPAVLRAALEGDPLDESAAQGTALQRLSPDAYVGGPTAEGVVVVSESVDRAWSVSADGRALPRATIGTTEVPVNTFAMTGEVQGLRVTADNGSRRWWLALQVGVLVVLLSLALRAPGRTLRQLPPDPSAVPDDRTRPPDEASPRAGPPQGSGVARGGGATSQTLVQPVPRETTR